MKLRLILFLLAISLSNLACERRARTVSDQRAAAPIDGAQATSVVANLEPKDEAPALFTEVTQAVGFEEHPPVYPDGIYLTPELTAGGVAVFDFNNDGLLDILLVCHPPPGPGEFEKTAPNRLYRQQTDGAFREIADAAGLGGRGFHTAVAIGDIDNDGFPDVLLLNFASPNQLFHNNGDGTFTDITKKAGLPANADAGNWSSAASFVDIDGDGFLDLVVLHFATFSGRPCAPEHDPRDLEYCGPHLLPPQSSVVYHNNRDGTFTDVTRKVGLNMPARGWGLIAGDLTGSGRCDLFQANDEEANQLWVNDGKGHFADEALIRGCAFNAAGQTQANMGVAVGDVLHTGNLDLFVTHISGETNILLLDGGGGNYTDATAEAGMGAIDRPFTGWGCGFLDFDNDGNLDLAVVNGRVAHGPTATNASVGPFWSRYAEPNLLFRGDGTGKFTDVSAAAGAFASRREVHRALAFADLRNRGAIDMICTGIDNTVRVFRNNAARPGEPGHHWLEVLPMIGKREALGARVILHANHQNRAALCLRNYSYISSNDPRIHFGLGQYSAPTQQDSVEVDWPSGAPRKEQFTIPAVDRLLRLRQGEGRAVE